MHYRNKSHKRMFIVGCLLLFFMAVTPAILFAQVGPTITSTAPITAVVAEEYSYQLNVTGDVPYTYTFTTTTYTPPTGMNVDTNGRVSWTPTDLQTGPHTVEVQVENPYGVDTEVFTVTVFEVPEIAAATPPSGLIGELYNYQVVASGSTPITFSFTTTNYLPPTGMNINNSGLIEWTPSVGQTGMHIVEVQALNNYGVDTQQFTITVNEKPAITSSAPDTVVVGATYQYQLDASGSEPITFSFTNTTYIEPAGMSMNGSGLISWMPPIEQTGMYTVEVQAENAYGFDTQIFTIDVYSLPEITSSANPTATVGVLYQYDVDADGIPSPTFSLVVTPTGMSIEPDTGLISWIPDNGQAGPNAVQVRATNDAGTDDQSFNIDVWQSPQVTSVPNDPTITAGQSFNGSASAFGFPVPDFSLVNNSPSWLSINPTTGAISGLSSQANAGLNRVTVQAENELGSDTDSFVLTVESTAICLYDPASYWPMDEVTNSTSPDLIWSNDGTCAGNTCPTPNGTALDFDGNNDGLDIENKSLMDWGANSNFTIQAWINTTQSCVGDDNKVIAGSYSSPAMGGSWWLGCGRDNNEAVFYLSQLGGINTTVKGTTAINDGQWHMITAVRDATSDQMRLYVDGVLDGTATFNFTNTFANNEAMHIGYFGTVHARDFYFDGLIDEVIIYNRVLSVAEIMEHRNYTLSDAAYCSETAVSPEIISSAPTTAIANAAYSYDVNATGLPRPTYSLLTKPSGMDIDPDTGEISWTPTIGQVGQHTVRVEVENSEGTVTQQYTIDVYEAPQITSTAPTTATTDVLYQYQLVASGSEPITFSFTNTTYTEPTGMTMNGSGLISWTPTDTQVGQHTIEVQAQSAHGVDTQQFTVEVYDAPSITSTAVLATVINKPYEYDVNAEGTPSPTYSLVVTPTGMTIDPTTGVINWTPTTLGMHAVTVRATNVAGIDEQSFNIEVVLHLSPTITSSPTISAYVGTHYSYDVEAIADPAPEFTLEGVYPDGMTIDAATGLIEWDIPSDYPEGPVSITVKAENIAGNDTQTFEIMVEKYYIYLPVIVK